MVYSGFCCLIFLNKSWIWVGGSFNGPVLYSTAGIGYSFNNIGLWTFSAWIKYAFIYVYEKKIWILQSENDVEHHSSHYEG